MKIYGTRRIRSTGTTEPAAILHATSNPNHTDNFKLYIVRRSYHGPTRTRKTDEPHITLVITSTDSEPKYDYHSIEIRFTKFESRLLEQTLARELGTRAVRRHAKTGRQLTRLEARKRLI